MRFCVWTKSTGLTFQKGKLYKITKYRITKPEKVVLIDGSGYMRDRTIDSLYKFIPVNNLSRILYDV